MNRPSDVLLAVDRYYQKVGENGWRQSLQGTLEEGCCVSTAIMSMTDSSILIDRTFDWLAKETVSNATNHPVAKVVKANDIGSYKGMRLAVRRAYRKAKRAGE